MLENLLDTLYDIFHPIETYQLWKLHQRKECVGLVPTSEEIENLINVFQQIEELL